MLSENSFREFLVSVATPFKQESRQRSTMADDTPTTTWFHSNRYSEQVACEHC